MKSTGYKVLIISCWVLLGFALGVKIFGANWFETTSNNANFIKFCEYIDSNNLLKYIIAILFSLVSCSLCLLAIMGQKFYTWKQAIVFLPLITISSIIGWKVYWLKNMLDVVILVIPLFYKVSWKRVALGILLIISFLVISMLAKNIGHLNINEDEIIVAYILQIDVIIMNVLYYLYSNYYQIKKLKGGNKDVTNE